MFSLVMWVTLFGAPIGVDVELNGCIFGHLWEVVCCRLDCGGVGGFVLAVS